MVHREKGPVAVHFWEIDLSLFLSPQGQVNFLLDRIYLHVYGKEPFTWLSVISKAQNCKKLKGRGRSQDGGGIGRGDHFLSYKFIERTIEWWTKFTKQLLIASSEHQVPRKAAHCLRRDVGQNIKDKKGDKRAREGSLNRGSFQSPGNPCAGGSGGSFQISGGNLTGRKN